MGLLSKADSLGANDIPAKPEADKPSDTRLGLFAWLLLSAVVWVSFFVGLKLLGFGPV